MTVFLIIVVHYLPLPLWKITALSVILFICIHLIKKLHSVAFLKGVIGPHPSSFIHNHCLWTRHVLFYSFLSILNFDGCFAYIWLFNAICNFLSPLPSGCNCPLHILSPIPYWSSPALPPQPAGQIALALLFRWLWSTWTAVLLLLLLCWWTISTERPVSNVVGTIDTKGACLKVRWSNENAVIANIHLLNARLWDHVINYTCTYHEASTHVEWYMQENLPAEIHKYTSTHEMHSHDCNSKSTCGWSEHTFTDIHLNMQGLKYLVKMGWEHQKYCIHCAVLKKKSQNHAVSFQSGSGTRYHF